MKAKPAHQLEVESRSQRIQQIAARITLGWPYLIPLVLCIFMYLAAPHPINLGALGLLPFAFVGVFMWVSHVYGYDPATPEQEQRIRAGYIWHMTTKVELVSAAQRGTVHVDSSMCRAGSRMFRRGRLRRPCRASYVFTRMPTQGEARDNVVGNRKATILELEGAAIRGPLYLRRRDQALALPNGYTGPARLVESRQRPN